jgi:hypothetical protein
VEWAALRVTCRYGLWRDLGGPWRKVSCSAIHGSCSRKSSLSGLKFILAYCVALSCQFRIAYFRGMVQGVSGSQHRCYGQRSEDIQLPFATPCVYNRRHAVFGRGFEDFNVDIEYKSKVDGVREEHRQRRASRREGALEVMRRNRVFQNANLSNCERTGL